MSKVLKIFLRQGYTPIDQEVFKLGTCIEFDCYIQRFNGFAILIEAGTFLDEKIYTKLVSSNLKIFIENKSYDSYKKYVTVHQKTKDYVLDDVDLKEEILNIEKLYKKLPKVNNVEEKLKIIYFVGKNFLVAWHKEKAQKIPHEVLDELAMSLATVIHENSVSLLHFKDIIQTRYSLQTHLLNVAFYSSIIGARLFYDIMDLKKLILSAILHDVGKCEIDESLLDKPDKLTQEEFEKVKKHANESVKISKKSGFSDKDILRGIAEHHEKLDGTGYPKGIKSSTISEFARIIALSDTFDALTTIKPYRGAYSTYDALMLIRKDFSKKLDLNYITILIKLLH